METEEIAMSDNGKAFNLFVPNLIKQLLNEKASDEEKEKLLDVVLILLRNTTKLDQKLHSSGSFSNLI